MSKSARQAQSQLLRQVIAEFDLETAINKIAVRSFNDLLQSNKQAFEYLNDNDKRMQELELRITKIEGFTSSIETNVNSKVEVMNSLNRRLEVFNREFHQSVIGSEQLVQTMRKDYDSLLSASQKNTFQLRSAQDDVKKTNAKVGRMDVTLEEGLRGCAHQLGEQTNQLQAQIIQTRTDAEKLSTAVAEARAQLNAKGTNFELVSQDVELYKRERQATDRRIKDLVKEVTTKANSADLSEMRLFFDSQLVTDQESTASRFAELWEGLREEVEERKREKKTMGEEATKKWGIQDRANGEMRQTTQEIKKDLQLKSQKWDDRVGKLEGALRSEIDQLSRRQERDVESLRKDVDRINVKGDQVDMQLADLQKFQQARHEEFIELESCFTALNETVNGIIQEGDKRKHDLQRLESETAQNNVGDEMNNMSGALEGIRGEILEQRRNVAAFKETLETQRQSLETQGRKQEKSVAELGARHKKLEASIAHERGEAQQRVTEVNRRISDVSIEIMNSVERGEREARKYTDELRVDLESKLELMHEMRKDMENLQDAFAGQMKETDRLNRALSQKMEKINSMLTKFKSDLILRIEANTNELVRRGIESKETAKVLVDLRRHISHLTEAVSIVLAVGIVREAIEEPGGEAVKVSSLLEGWVLEVEDKVSKYRGESVQRKKLLWVCLNFLSHQGDKVKGGVIESGKDVYQCMMDEQELFTARRRGLSKKGGSELPKLHY